MLAFIVKGLTGFGAGLLMVPLLVLFIDVKVVVPLLVAFAILANFFLLVTFQTWKWVRRDLLPQLVAGGVFGTVLGTFILASYRSELLEKLCGVFIFGYALYRLWNRGERGDDLRHYMGLVAGFTSGVIGGMFGTGGPPVVIYLGYKLVDKRTFRSTLTGFFLIMDVWQMATLRYAGLMDREVFVFIVYLLPAFVVGNLLGSVLHIRIDQAMFDRIVALVLMVAGLFLIF